MKHTELLERINGQRVLVLGAGQSGGAALELLEARTRPAALGVADQLPATAWQTLDVHALRAKGIEVVAAPKSTRFLKDWDLFIISPGFPPHHPWLQNPRVQANGYPEFELGYVMAPDGVWIGITGTNGKTTSTSWITRMLDRAGLPAVACGNIGEPLSRIALNAVPGTYYVVELSSFQLYAARYFHPHIAVLLNLDLDHLDWHGSGVDYMRAKFRLFAHQTPADWAVLNRDEVHLWSAYRELKAHKCFFGQTPVQPGIGVHDGWLMVYWERAYPLLPVAALASTFPFMITNAMATALTGLLLHLTLDQIRQGLTEYRPLPHRLEWVDRVDGIDFYDDSKATNVHAVRWALASLPQPIVLIAGGQAKGQDFTPLVPVLSERVRCLILIGEDRDRIRRQVAPSGVPIFIAESLSEAVEKALAHARPGDAVLLSPGCASFDMFDNYAHRGDVFREEVRRHKASYTSTVLEA